MYRHPHWEPVFFKKRPHEPLSKLLVYPLMTPIRVPPIQPPIKEFRLWLILVFAAGGLSVKNQDYSPKWVFPKIRGTILGGRIIRSLIFWGPPILGNFQMPC